MSSFAPDTMRLGVAVGGFGAIGKVVAEHLDRGIEGLTLAAVSARDIVRAEATMAGFAWPVPVVPLANLWEYADLIVECASQRKESRGLHYTVDYPERNDIEFARDTVL